MENKNRDFLKVKNIINSVVNTGQLEVAIKTVEVFRSKYGLRYDSSDIKLLNKLIELKRTEFRINRTTGVNLTKPINTKEKIKQELKKLTQDEDTIDEESYWGKDPYWSNDPYWGTQSSSSSE
jgi:hypothetical protein